MVTCRNMPGRPSSPRDRCSAQSASGGGGHRTF